MGYFEPKGLKASKLSPAWRKYVKQGNANPPTNTVMSINPSSFICGTRASFTVSFDIDLKVPKGGFILFDLPQGWGGGKNEKDQELLEKAGGVRAFLEKSKEPLDAEIISRGSRLSIIQIHFSQIEAESGSTVVVEMPPLLPCDRPGTYNFHAFVSNSHLEPAPVLCPELQVYPDRFEGFDLLYPSSTDTACPERSRRDRKFSLRIRARSGPESSYFTFPDYTGEIEVLGEGIRGRSTRIIFSKETQGFSRVDGLRLKNKEGRMKVSSNGRQCEGHPMISSELIDGLQVFFGDLHLHTSLSDGMGSPEEAYRWAAESAGLDFIALNDHVEDRLTYASTWNKETWTKLLNVAEEFNKPGDFVTIPGVEISGAVNLYFKDGSFPFYPFHELDKNEEAIGKFLTEIASEDRVLFAYHKLADLDEYYLKFPPPALLEIIQHKRTPEQGLERFLPLCHQPPAFLGGTDSHSGMAGSPPMGFSRNESQYGLTGVFAEKLTRKHIFTALRQGRTYATSGQRSILLVTINEIPMGGTVSLSSHREPLTVALFVRACHEVKLLEVLCNGTIVYTSYPGAKNIDLSVEMPEISTCEPWTCPKRSRRDGKQYFVYVRIQETTGDMAWTTPVLITKDVF